MNAHVVRRLDRGTVPVAHDVHGDKGHSDGEQNPTIEVSSTLEPDGSSTTTYHSKAAKTHAARRDVQARPPQTRSLLRKTASAMNPANQKSMVRTSMARMANLWAARGISHGERVR